MNVFNNLYGQMREAFTGKPYDSDPQIKQPLLKDKERTQSAITTPPKNLRALIPGSEGKWIFDILIKDPDLDVTYDFKKHHFVCRYAALACMEEQEGLEKKEAELVKEISKKAFGKVILQKTDCGFLLFVKTPNFLDMDD
jgi:hypothetical protein